MLYKNFFFNKKKNLRHHEEDPTPLVIKFKYDNISKSQQSH